MKTPGFRGRTDLNFVLTSIKLTAWDKSGLGNEDLHKFHLAKDDDGRATANNFTSCGSSNAAWSQPNDQTAPVSRCSSSSQHPGLAKRDDAAPEPPPQILTGQP